MMKEGKLYFLKRADGLIKVGFTTNIATRLASLTRSHGPLHVIRVINGDLKREHQIHAQFARSHEFGEWFRDSPELQTAIAAIPEGPSIALSKSEVAKQWALGEVEFAAKAFDKITNLLRIRRQRTGGTDKDCLASISKDYGIAFNFMRHFLDRKPSSVSAFALSRLSEALITEMTLLRDELLEDVRRVEAGEPLIERGTPQRYATAARVAAKKQARGLR